MQFKAKLKGSHCWPADTSDGKESNYSESGWWDNEHSLHCLLCVIATGCGLLAQVFTELLACLRVACPTHPPLQLR